MPGTTTGMWKAQASLGRFTKIFMNNLRVLVAAAVSCGGALLAGCHQQEPAAGSIPIPAPSATPPVQAQMQDVDSNPHIPDAQKAAIKASIAAHAPASNETAPGP